MVDSATKLREFKSLLDKEHVWPCEYIFKFIVISDLLFDVVSRLDREGLSFKDSSSGKYVSVTYKKIMNSSDEVMSIYQKVSTVPGVITL